MEYEEMEYEECKKCKKLVPSSEIIAICVVKPKSKELYKEFIVSQDTFCPICAKPIINMLGDLTFE